MMDMEMLIVVTASKLSNRTGINLFWHGMDVIPIYYAKNVQRKKMSQNISKL
jgi:hypothetical protein